MSIFRLRKRKGQRYATTPFDEAADRGAYLRPKKGLTLFNRKGQTIRPGKDDSYVMERPARKKRKGLFGGRGGTDKRRAPNPNRGKMRDTGLADVGREASNFRSDMQRKGYKPYTVDLLTTTFFNQGKKKRRK